MSPSPTDLAASVAAQAREPSDDLEALIGACCEDVVLDATKTRSRVHLVARDANGHVRVPALTKLLAAQVVDFCIPRPRRDEAMRHLQATGSTEELMRLREEARRAFTDLENSGEAGELLLYMLLERMLGLPQLLCKMSLKTSRRMHVHGTDGIHARFETDGRLGLYWGESKLHKGFASAVDSCLESLAPYLDPAADAREQDLLLLRDHVNVDDRVAIEALRRYFLETTPEHERVELRGACLVGFDQADYPSRDDPRLPRKIGRWRKRISDQVAARQLESLEIEFFCVPFPSIDAFRAAVHKELGTS